MDNEQYWIFPPNVKQKVQKKINLLRKTTSQVSSMETELTKLKLQKAKLEKELERFRLKHSEVRLGPIARCPDEVLLLIFEHFLNSDHPLIRILLFVCKRWYDIVMNRPCLWARIKIDDALTLFPYKYCPSLTQAPYIIACYERSKGLPLDVELFLYEFPSIQEYLREELYRAARGITDDSEHDEIAGKIFEKDWDHDSKWINTELSRTLDCIFGANDTNIKRWRSLELCLPSHEETARTIWRRIRQSTFSVVKLDITNLPSEWDEQERDQSDVPHLPLIQHLAFEGTPEQVRVHLDTFPTTLEILEIIIDETTFFTQLSSLSALTSLRILILHIKGLSAERPQLALPQLDLQRLEVLTLYASSRYIQLDDQDTEKIQSATWNLLQRLRMLFGASIRHISWSLSGEDFNIAPGTWVIQRKKVNITREITIAADQMENYDLKGWARRQVLNAMQSISGKIGQLTLMVTSGRRRENSSVLHS